MKLHVVVLVCDGAPNSKGDAYAPESVKFPEESIPVTLEGRTREKDDFSGIMQDMIGSAKLGYRGPYLIAELTLLDTRITSEMLDILYPIPVGVVEERQGNLIRKARMTRLGLDISASADKRIYTLGRQSALQRS